MDVLSFARLHRLDGLIAVAVPVFAGAFFAAPAAAAPAPVVGVGAGWGPTSLSFGVEDAVLVGSNGPVTASPEAARSFSVVKKYSKVSMYTLCAASNAGGCTRG